MDARVWIGAGLGLLVAGEAIAQPEAVEQESVEEVEEVEEATEEAEEAIAQPAGGGWLDAETPNWNEPEMEVPAAPTSEDSNLMNCRGARRGPTLPEDRLLTGAGWALFGPAQVYGKTVAITAASDADGMCRPLAFQAFIFHDGEFVGMLSPAVMNSRTDGAISRMDLFRDNQISATFHRYTPDDALCCPSGLSQVFYAIDVDADDPVLLPTLPAETRSISN